MSMAAARVGKPTVKSGGGRFDLWLGRLTEWPAAALVVVEICVLFAGVVSRYVVNRPLIWSDELASILFLWLAMLGAVVALRRDEHMRLTAVAMMLPPIWQARLRALAAAVVAVFVLEIVSPAREYVEAQWFITTPALEIHDSFRVAAIIVGALLMLLIAVRRLVAGSTLPQMLGALAVVGVVAVGFWFAKPWLMSLGIGNLVVFFVILVAICVAVGVPIAFSFGVATMSYLAVVTRMPLTIVVSRMDEGMSGLVLLAVPLFVFLGLLIEMTGLARVLVAFMASIVGHAKGGLAYVLLGAMYLVSGISGSKAADMAAVAPALFPEMKQRGAAPGELVALLSASGAMAETIPPSLVLITIGSVTGVSIAALFTGGLLPAAVGAVALAVVARLRCRHDDVSQIEKASWREIGKRFVIAVPALILPFVIRAAVVDGIATATEVSTVGIIYTILVGLFVYRQFDWGRVLPILVETASLSGAILLIIGTATAMAWALTQSGFSHSLVATMSAVSGGPLGFLAISILVFTVLGSVLEGIPAIVLFGPLLFPVARALGINEVHYAIVVVLAMGMGLFAPPFGVGFYAACAIGRVSPDAAMARVWPYLAVLLAATLLIAAVPWLSIGFL
jgi:tripartite ATP-independent transporter DctM subunit